MKLPSRLDTNYAETLRAELLRAQREKDTVDASEVTYVGGLCFQILIASGLPVAHPSTAFTDAMRVLGG